jgi:hypothetical protein
MILEEANSLLQSRARYMDPDRCSEVLEGPPFPNLELVSTSEGTCYNLKVMCGKNVIFLNVLRYLLGWNYVFHILKEIFEVTT